MRLSYFSLLIWKPFNIHYLFSAAFISHQFTSLMVKYIYLILPLYADHTITLRYICNIF